MDNINSILVLAPHPDDGEFGAGASISRWLSEGREVHYVAFSPCIASLPQGSPDDLLHQELKKATEVLGIPAGNVVMKNFEVRKFPSQRQEILEYLVSLKKELTPDLVLVPASTDIHQDHQVINQEAKRAFKHSCLLGYELPWNTIEFRADFHIKTSLPHLTKKFEALSCYGSQLKRNYHDLDFITGLARVRGVQVGADLAEAFESIRWIVD